MFCFCKQNIFLHNIRYRYKGGARICKCSNWRRGAYQIIFGESAAHIRDRRLFDSTGYSSSGA